MIEMSVFHFMGILALIVGVPMIYGGLREDDSFLKGAGIVIGSVFVMCAIALFGIIQVR